jgi:hypothetical protein
MLRGIRDESYASCSGTSYGRTETKYEVSLQSELPWEIGRVRSTMDTPEGPHQRR